MTVKIERDRLIKVSQLHQDTAKWVEAAKEGPLYGAPKSSPKLSKDLGHKMG